MLNIALTNLGKYNEGDLVYRWLELPFTKEQLEIAKKRICINDEYEEYFVSDDEITDEHEFFNDFVTEYVNIEQLNDVVTLFDDLDDKSKAAFICWVQDYAFDSISEIHDRLEEFDVENFSIYEGSVETIGLELLNEYLQGNLDSRSIKFLEPFFDAEAFGLEWLEDFTNINIYGNDYFVCSI